MNDNPRTYVTLAAPARRERRVQGSRFLAEANPAGDEPAARARRDVLGAEFRDATHHCWALRLRAPGGPRELSHDAGEPAGTAGVPILQAMRGAGILDAQVVVVRWFGGTKLGKGGLARAYREVARLAIEAAGPAEVVPVARLSLSGPVGVDGEVRHAIACHGGRVVEAAYDGGAVAHLVIEVAETAVRGLCDEVARLTRGRWKPDPIAPPGEGTRRGR